MNLLYLEIGIIPIESSKLKLWHFHAKLVSLPILHLGQSKILIFRGLNSIPDTGSLYSFEAKVLRVLLKLESPKSGAPKLKICPKQPGLLYVKKITRNLLEHSPTLSDFLG